MTLIGLALLALPSLMLALKAADSRLSTRETAGRPVEGAEPLAPAATYPDVCYVVLVAYARGDVLQDLYSLDNSAFLQAPTARGFYVASESRANYSQTAQSLASSLNSTYLDDLALSRGAESVNSAPLQEMVQHSLVRRSLEGLGYQTAAFETSYPLTELTDADRFLTPPYGELARSGRLGSACRSRSSRPCSSRPRCRAPWWMPPAGNRRTPGA